MEILDDPIVEGWTVWDRLKSYAALPLVILVCAFACGTIGWCLGVRSTQDSQEYKLGRAVIDSCNQLGHRPYTITIH